MQGMSSSAVALTVAVLAFAVLTPPYMPLPPGSAMQHMMRNTVLPTVEAAQQVMFETPRIFASHVPPVSACSCALASTRPDTFEPAPQLINVDSLNTTRSSRCIMPTFLLPAAAVAAAAKQQQHHGHRCAATPSATINCRLANQLTYHSRRGAAALHTARTASPSPTTCSEQTTSSRQPQRLQQDRPQFSQSHLPISRERCSRSQMPLLWSAGPKPQPGSPVGNLGR